MDKLSIGSQSYVAKLRRSGSKFILNLDEETYEGDFSRKNRGLIQINLEGVNSIGFSERKGNEIYVIELNDDLSEFNFNNIRNLEYLNLEGEKERISFRR